MKIYTDGSAHPNPGPGGYGVIVVNDHDEIVEYYSEQFKGPVTNNEMEIKAILWAFEHYGLKDDGWCMPNVIYSDSAYCVNTFETWMFSWARYGWIKSDNKVPENLELIKRFYNHWNKGYRINFKKVKGHSGNKYNELVDELATGKRTKI